ncbi:hypothetical protein KR084_012363, partial [Drosophila pseudotakahashii]
VCPIFCSPRPVEPNSRDTSAANSTSNFVTMTANPCIFCLDEQRFPHRISCGHSFCAECFVKYLELGRDSRCPLCRRDFRPDLQPPLPVDDTAEESGAETEADTLVLTLSEQECRFFEQLYRGLLANGRE